MAVAVKLASLVIKTLSKPVARSFKKSAEKDGWFRTLCAKYGAFHHKLESRITLRLQGVKVKSIKDIPEEKAISKGADVFSEAFIFSTAAMVVTWEYARKDRQAEAKAEKARLKQEADDAALDARFDAVEENMRQLEMKFAKRQADWIVFLEQEFEVLEDQVESLRRQLGLPKIDNVEKKTLHDNNSYRDQKDSRDKRKSQQQAEQEAEAEPGGGGWGCVIA